MIEISHEQARRMIRDLLDGRDLPDTQWAALQAHLEDCPACRDYRAARRALEQNLGHMLRARWGGQPANPRPAAELSRGLIAHQQARPLRQRNRLRLGLLLAAMLALSAYLLTRPPAAAPNPAALGPSITPTSTATATPAPHFEFRGALLFADARAGDSDIYLLSPGNSGALALTNLTNDPAANDSDPAWSPDGQWVAFLSDRTGKREVYAMHIAGTRLTQLTDTPQVDWQGPLSWSPDGHWIALRGARYGVPLVYVVPVNRADGQDASGAFSLPNTRYVQGAPLFAPNSVTRLGYIDASGGINVVPMANTTNRYRTNAFDDPEHIPMPRVFDWLSGGKMAFLANVETAGTTDTVTGSQYPPNGTRTQLLLGDDYADNGRPMNTRAIYQTTGVDSLRGLVTDPRPDSQSVAFLQQSADAPDCWTIRLGLTNRLDLYPLELTGLCVDGTLTRGSWLAQDWLLVTAHVQDEPTLGIYAVRIPADLPTSGRQGSVGGQRTLAQFERLMDAPRLPHGESTDPPLLQARPLAKAGVNPLGVRVTIDPRPARPAPLPPPPTNLGGLRGQLFYRLDAPIQNDNNLQRLDLPPVPGARADEYGPFHYLSCVTLSPDGRQLAMLTSENRSEPITQSVQVMDTNGGNGRQIPLPAAVLPDAGSLQLSSCPTWSPDGTQLVISAQKFEDDQMLLLFLPTALNAPPSAGRVWALTPAARVETPPVWMPPPADAPVSNMGSLFFVQSGDPINGPSTSRELVRLDLNGADPRSMWYTSVMEAFAVGEGVGGMVVSPDGQRIAYLVSTQFNNDTRDWRGMRLSYRLVIRDGIGQPNTLINNLISTEAGNWILGDSLTWLPDGGLAFVARIDGNGPSQSVVYRVDAGSSPSVHAIITLDDVINATAWSRTGEWLLYGGQWGIMGLHLPTASTGQSGPAQISPVMTYVLKWSEP